MKASYDVIFVPMTNVVIDTDNPLTPSEKEQFKIVDIAAEKIKDCAEEKLNNENVAQIRLYSIGDKEQKHQKVIYDSGDLRESANPIDESVRLLTDLANSGYIPFSSPSPSSTEVKLRNCISSAISLLENAQMLEKDLGYRKP